MHQLLNLPENADLLTAWPALAGPDAAVRPEQQRRPRQRDRGSAHPGPEVPTAFTDEQLGRLDAIMNQVLTLTRGDANGIMYAQYDDAMPGPQNVLSSDMVVNNQRDGTNTRIILTIVKNATSGNFVVRLTNGTTRPVFRTSPSLPSTRPAITPSSIRIGRYRPFWRRSRRPRRVGDQLVQLCQPAVLDRPDGTGPVSVRLLTRPEVTDRQGTYWDLAPDGVNTTQYVYEISFLGEVHDTSISHRAVAGNWNTLTDQRRADTRFRAQSAVCDGDLGHGRHLAARLRRLPSPPAATTSWPGPRTTPIPTAGSVSSQNIYYRTYQESTDTAGPQVAEWFTPDGTVIDSNAQIYASQRIAAHRRLLRRADVRQRDAHGRRRDQPGELRPVAQRRQGQRRHCQGRVRNEQGGRSGR